MTNTEAHIPLSEQRRRWIVEISNSLSLETTTAEYLQVLNRIRSEGPGLALPTNERWQKRFRWIDLQLEHGREVQWIVLQVLIDLNYANAPARLS